MWKFVSREHIAYMLYCIVSLLTNFLCVLLSSSTAVSGDRSHGVTKIKYRRLLQTNEAVNDRAYPLDRQISVIAAIGPLNSRDEANAHSHTGTEVTVDDVQIDFASKNDHTCTDALDSFREEDGPEPWPSRTILGEKTITARIGPTGGKRGYTPITGHPSWGIAWYMNDLLIPEIYVERGQTYTFIVEGGDETTQPAKYVEMIFIYLC